MNFVSDCNPTVSALYLVDRGMQGKHYRWYDADKDQWSMCGWTMQEALDNRDKVVDIVGFFPWAGPINLRPKQEVMPDPVPKPRGRPKKVVADVTPEPVVKSKAGRPKKSAKVNMAVGSNAKENGTIFYREDRNKWVVLWDGKQEAARDSIEACQKFLKKKYNVEGVVQK